MKSSEGLFCIKSYLRTCNNLKNDEKYEKNMINDDILVKYSVSNIRCGYIPRNNIRNWVDYVKYLSAQLREIRDLDFTSIGLNDLSIINPGDIEIGSRLILSDHLDNNENLPHESDTAVILGLCTKINPLNHNIIELEIEGLGHRSDISRDPDRQLQWGSVIYPNLSNYHCLLRLDSVPRTNGSSVYHYFNKFPRDSRDSYIPGKPKESARACIGIIRELSYQDLYDNRPRSQYMFFYRKNLKELCKILEEYKEQDETRKTLMDLYSIYSDHPIIIKKTSKEISKHFLDYFGV